MASNKYAVVEVHFFKQEIPLRISDLIEFSDRADFIGFHKKLKERGGFNDIPDVVYETLISNLGEEKRACDFYFSWEFEGKIYAKCAQLRPVALSPGIKKTPYGEQEKRKRFMQFRYLTIEKMCTQEEAIGRIALDCRKSESTVRDEIKQQKKLHEKVEEVSNRLIELSKKIKSQDGN